MEEHDLRRAGISIGRSELRSASTHSVVVYDGPGTEPADVSAAIYLLGRVVEETT